jgi:hypothetical protein
MLTADESTTEDALSGSQARYRMDDTLLVKFFNHPVQDNVKTEEAGRPIFKEHPYVSIEAPGNRLNRIVRPAMEMDKQRFSRHWRKFLDRESQSMEGTPLAEWGGVTRSQIEEMKFFNILTVEQLASISDSNTQNMRGLQGLKQKAATYLEASDKNAVSNELTALRAEVEAMKSQNAELLARKPAAKAKRKRRSPAEMAAAKVADEAAAEAALDSLKTE